MSSMILIPVGCVVPLYVGHLLKAKNLQPFGGAAFFLFMLGLLGFLLMFLSQSRFKDRIEIFEETERLGLQWGKKDERDQYAQILMTLFLYENSHGEMIVKDLLTGKWKGIPLAFMEASYVRRDIDDAIVQTVVVIPGASKGLPDFLLRPKTWFDKIEQSIGFAKRFIEIPEMKAFSDKYLFTGQNPNFLKAFFRGPPGRSVLGEKDLTIEVKGDFIISKL